MGRPRKSSRRVCKRGRKCKGVRRKTNGAYKIPKEFACARMRGPATSIITTNWDWNAWKNDPNLAIRVGKTTNGSYGWSNQQVDDQQSSGLGYGPKPFKTTNAIYNPELAKKYRNNPSLGILSPW